MIITLFRERTDKPEDLNEAMTALIALKESGKARILINDEESEMPTNSSFKKREGPNEGNKIPEFTIQRWNEFLKFDARGGAATLYS